MESVCASSESLRKRINLFTFSAALRDFFRIKWRSVHFLWINVVKLLLLLISSNEFQFNLFFSLFLLLLERGVREFFFVLFCDESETTRLDNSRVISLFFWQQNNFFHFFLNIKNFSLSFPFHLFYDDERTKKNEVYNLQCCKSNKSRKIWWVMLCERDFFSADFFSFSPWTSPFFFQVVSVHSFKYQTQSTDALMNFLEQKQCCIMRSPPRVCRGCCFSTC